MIKRSIVLACLVGVVGAAAADPKAGILGPKGPAEVADMAKMMTGTWKCDGNLIAPDQKTMKIAGTMKTALELNGVWLHESMDGSVGEGKTVANFKFEAFITFDGALKKWRRLEVNSLGGHALGTADPIKDGKMEWSGEMTRPDGTKEMDRTHLDASDAKKGVHITSEVTIDKGKSWLKAADITCQK